MFVENMYIIYIIDNNIILSLLCVTIFYVNVYLTCT
jgi:hypothetical protein